MLNFVTTNFLHKPFLVHFIVQFAGDRREIQPQFIGDEQSDLWNKLSTIRRYGCKDVAPVLSWLPLILSRLATACLVA